MITKEKEVKTNLFHKRDISWLAFSHRVLQEATDNQVPLFERLKFLAIFSSNLDEFYRVRVASLRGVRALEKAERQKYVKKPKKILREIRKIVQEQQEIFGQIFQQIIALLEEEGVHIVLREKFTEYEKEKAREVFLEKLYPHINCTIINCEQDTYFLENRKLYLIVKIKDKPGQLGVINIPSNQVDRFTILSSENRHYRITFIDEIIRSNLQEIIPDAQDAYSVKISRDAELYIDDEFEGDLIEKIKKAVDERKSGLPTRFLYDATMPDKIIDYLKSCFHLSKNDMIPGGRHHNFNDFFNFPDPTHNPAFQYQTMEPLPHPSFQGVPSIMKMIWQKDQIIHLPYQSFEYIPKLIQEAAEHPDVSHIKMTLYRTSPDSVIAKSLIWALDAGKKVTVFIEVKARFDEQNNLFWGDRLKEKGAFVIYSYPGIKIHSKLLLIQCENNPNSKDVCYISTGNFNERTSKTYTDHGLFTSNQAITREVNLVFHVLERKIIIPLVNHLLVSPFNTRQAIIGKINREIIHASQGNTAWIKMKMNNLEDHEVIAKLYEASQSGVHIQLIIRGICCLKPGIPGLSDNIEAISIVDRFLEHARIYHFHNNGSQELYMGSADMMVRNLDRRIEVLTPVYDPEILSELKSIFDIQWSDCPKSRILNVALSNPYRCKDKSVQQMSAQNGIYNYLKMKGSNDQD